MRHSNSERSKLIKSCDDVFREIIRKRDDGVCQVTKQPCVCDVAHFFSRAILATRWDEDNACLIAKGKHRFWAHIHHERFRDFWVGRIGQERFDRLKLKADKITKYYTDDLRMMLFALRSHLGDM